MMENGKMATSKILKQIKLYLLIRPTKRKYKKIIRFTFLFNFIFI
jgi:hypothetical protein